jgi:uncharacterized protein (DUF433 family)
MMTRPATLQRITQDPTVLDGKPVIRGTRIPVSLSVDFVASGNSVEEILNAYPALTPDDIAAALAYEGMSF